VGVITVDDIIDVINEEATEDMYRLAGLDEEDRVFSTTGQSLKRRLPWNVLNLCTAFLAASVVGAFEETIGQAVVLATFMPIVAGMGGNTGVQTLTVVTRGIALGELQFSSGVRAVVKELGVGVTIGLVMGSLTAVIATLWKGNPMLGVVLVLAMVCNMAIAAFMGAAIPLLLKAVKKDPALGGGIMLTAFTDTFGFLTFLGLASLFITHLT
jgi:magnesium transporter